MTVFRLGYLLSRVSVGAALLLALLLLVESAHSEPVSDRDRAIADLEKQIAELKQKINTLKKEETSTAKKPLTLEDAAKWKAIRGAAISNDGAWFAAAIGASDEETEVIVRQTHGDKQWKFSAGKGGGSDIEFADSSAWLVFRTAAPKGSKGGGKAVLVNLKNGEKKEWEGIRRADFSGEAATWVALHRTPAPGPTPAAGSTTPPSSGDRSSGTDLILHELATGGELILGNVSEYGFNKQGKHLALLIDAQGQVGNGIQLRNMTTGVLTALESDRATYQKLRWTDDGNALAVLKGSEDKAYEDKRYSVLGYTDFDAKSPRKVAYDPRNDTSFPTEMTISPNRAASWREDLSALTFGIHELKKKKSDDKKETPSEKDTPKDRTASKEKETNKEKDEKTTTTKKKSEKPDLVVWHWQDERLQSMQQVEANTDKNQNYAALYQVAEKKFVRLADDKLREVAIPARGGHGLGIDRKPYQLQSTLDGKRLADVYAVDLKTGARKEILKKVRWLSGVSPDGKWLLYFDDGQYRACELATGKTTVLTANTPTSFIDTEDDHNVDRPPTTSFGWNSESNAVLLSDAWDLWLVPLTGEAGINLTVDAKKESLRYRSRYRLDPDEKGIDFSKPQYFSIQAEWTKQAGIARIDGSKPGAKKLLWDDAEFGSVHKAEKADTFIYTRETYQTFPDYYATGADFKTPHRLTDANPQQSKFFWCSGTQLIEYTGARGEKLQGMLLLPAGYEKGKSYPTIVYIYEKLSDRRNRYLTPSVPGGGFNASLYTSGGYAVLMPDISYKINDPGVSAVSCVLAALKAAEKTGIVDAKLVGLHGHSWGGYQTSFIITQTNVFKAAVAGAPLTNLVSMYSSIYWNTGSANQPIFESSQGRFTSGYWDNQEAYLRNSPVFHARKVETPLILLHNDKDGAVDWNQGIEYFNTLRRLQKPVVLLQYKGENHGLVKMPNRLDYAERMREFFDHYLKGKPAPEWLKEGIPYLKLDEHLKGR